MKIAYFIDSEIPTQKANMVHVMKMCRAFALSGIEVTLYCNRKADHLDAETIFRQYGAENCFHLETVRLPEFLQNHGHRFGSYYSAWLKAKRFPGDGYAYSRSALTLFFLRNKAEYIYESHLEPDAINLRIERAVLKHTNCRGLVVISQALKNRYLELFPFFSEDRITVLHDAADLDMSGSDVKAPLQASSSDVRIGYVGSLFPGKCMETLLPLAERCPHLCFHIVGGTEYWVDYWKSQAQSRGISNLKFYGHIDNSKVGDYYRAFDVCILPFSRDIHIGRSKRVNIGQWTSPLKLFEAMAYAKPIIVSRLSTIAEVMTDREDCIMVEPDNIDDWAEKLTALCADSELREHIGLSAQKKLSREYTWKERARRVAKLFE